jgi:hypothetical protein
MIIPQTIETEFSLAEVIAKDETRRADIAANSPRSLMKSLPR